MANHRHHQAAIGLCCQPQVQRRKARQYTGIVIVAGVDFRVRTHRQHQGANQKRQQGQAATLLAVLGVKFGAQRFKLGDVHFFDIGEVGNAPLGLLHLLCNFAPQANHRNGFLCIKSLVTTVCIAWCTI
ncbi:hypothetical protein GALL_474800 [mine drainage metagenome]|uniref:Uncharacterized protein n=1 Tax=mine drainage metagenome TaxID=410659 RepID=A0A1J5PI85_9ZZZZ